jgi:hypothetical protein
MAKAGRKPLVADRYPSGRIKPPSVRNTKTIRLPRDQVDEYLDRSENLTLKRLMYGRCTTAVYVMISGDDRAVKIGVSDEPSKRCAGLQTGQDQRLRVFWAVRMTREHAFDIEKAAHTRLQRTCQHIRGEWYWMPGNVAVDEINKMIAQKGYEHRSDLQYGYDRLLQEIG